MNETTTAENAADQIGASVEPATTEPAGTDTDTSPVEGDGGATEPSQEAVAESVTESVAESGSPPTEATVNQGVPSGEPAGAAAAEHQVEPESVVAEPRPARCEVETQAAVETAVAQDPLEQPEPEDVHEVALEPEIPATKAVLVIQTDGQVRGTLAGGCRTLPWLAVHTASSVELGEDLIKEETPDAIILSLDEGAEAVDLLTRIRLGECRVDAGVPVMALIQQATAEIVAQLKPLGVTRLLLHPFTLGDVLETVEGMWTADGAPVVMPTDAEALKEAAEAKADSRAKAEAEAESAAADASEGDASAEPEVGSDTPVEGTSAEAAAESEPVPA